MFDNLRDEPNSTPFYEDEAQFQAAPSGSAPLKSSASSSDRRLLGMSAQQRFILTMMLLIMVCLLGSACLLLTGKLALF